MSRLFQFVRLLTALFLLIRTDCWGFVVVGGGSRQPTAFITSTTPSRTSLWQATTTTTTADDGGASLQGAEYLEFELVSHKPLGCTAEECLGPTGHVFVSKLVPGGNAEKAGLEMGDVIVGVTGLFGELDDVSGQGIDKVKGLVAARPEDEPLLLRVARGTNVFEEHEKALVELCSDPTLDSKESEECIVSFLKEGYNMDMEEPVLLEDTDDEAETVSLETDDEDSLVANMYSMWAEDIDEMRPEGDTGTVVEETVSEPSAKPWSSRSSPSGTYVRDPQTGAMRNIDS